MGVMAAKENFGKMEIEMGGHILNVSRVLAL
jgi:hypothetical protein